VGGNEVYDSQTRQDRAHATKRRWAALLEGHEARDEGLIAVRFSTAPEEKEKVEGPSRGAAFRQVETTLVGPLPEKRRAQQPRGRLKQQAS